MQRRHFTPLLATAALLAAAPTLAIAGSVPPAPARKRPAAVSAAPSYANRSERRKAARHAARKAARKRSRKG